MKLGHGRAIPPATTGVEQSYFLVFKQKRNIIEPGKLKRAFFY